VFQSQQIADVLSSCFERQCEHPIKCVCVCVCAHPKSFGYKRNHKARILITSVTMHIEVHGHHTRLRQFLGTRNMKLNTTCGRLSAAATQIQSTCTPRRRQQQGEVLFSTVANGTCDHVWDQEFILDVSDLESSFLVLSLWCPSIPRAALKPFSARHGVLGGDEGCSWHRETMGRGSAGEQPLSSACRLPVLA
jgi:hypothetical protein